MSIKPSRMQYLILFLLCISRLAAQDLSSVQRWGYQLEDIFPEQIHASSFDLVVIDYSRDGSPEGVYSRKEMDLMKKKTDGSSRIVLAYLSIGEAEDYRYYWKTKYKRNKPSWLGDENPDWPGNYKVKYWDTTWQHIIYGQPDSYLDKILEMGFDGVYLDIIDGFEYYQDSIPDAQEYMAKFVSGISEYAKAKSKKPFYIIGQNGETLIDNSQYLKAIDGIGKEDLYYGLEGDEKKNDPEEIAFSLHYLQRALAFGKKVFIIEYTSEADKIDSLLSYCRKENFCPYFTDRSLSRLNTFNIKGYSKDGITPGRFYSVILPKGTVRTQLMSEYYTEKYLYYIRKTRDEDYEFVGKNYFEWTNAAVAYYCFRTNWEFGIHLPIVYAQVTPDSKDHINIQVPYKYTGIGMMQLMLNHGKSWNHYNDNLLLEINIGLPTDIRKHVFNPGTYGRASLTREHYGKKIGLIGVAAVNYYTNSDLTGWGFAPELQAGIGIKVSEKIFCSTMMVQELEKTRTEIGSEFIIGKHASIEANLGKGLINSWETFYVSFGVNFIFR